MKKIDTLLLSLLLPLAASCGGQPKNRCKVAPGLAIAKYTRTAPPTGTCTGVVLPVRAESVGIQPYVPSPTDPNAPDTVTSFSLKPLWLGERISEARDLAAADPALAGMKDALVNYPYGSAALAPPPTDLTTTKRPYAYGRFDANNVFPGDDGVCNASAVNESDLVYPAIPAYQHPDPDDATKPPVSVPAQPETAVKYTWSHVRVIQIPLSPGTQTFADLTITRDGCSASYQAALLVPKVGCGKEDATGKVVADPTACDPSPNETNIFGSGISQGVPTQCQDLSSDPANPEQNDPMNPDFVCVPTKTAP